MSWQEPAVALIVLAAASYLVHKLFLRSAPRNEPDVPLSRLRRPKDKKAD